MSNLIFDANFSYSLEPLGDNEIDIDRYYVTRNDNLVLTTTYSNSIDPFYAIYGFPLNDPRVQMSWGYDGKWNDEPEEHMCDITHIAHIASYEYDITEDCDEQT